MTFDLDYKITENVDLNLKLYCKDCKDPIPNIVENFAAGDLVCGNCGLVLGNRIIDTRSEWRTFSNSDEGNNDPSRVGGVIDPLRIGQNLDSTTIATGRRTSHKLNRTMNKILDDKNKKELIDAFNDIQSIADKMSLLKNVSDTAKQLYKLAKDNIQKEFKNVKRESIIAYCIYVACKLQNNPHSVKEICTIFKVPKKNFMYYCTLLKNILLTQSIDISSYSANETSKIDSYIECFGYRLSLPSNVRKIAKTVAHNASKDCILGGTAPTTLVAACIYLATKKDPKTIAEVCGCTESTIKKAYQKLYEKRNEISSLDIPKDAWFNP